MIREKIILYFPIFISTITIVSCIILYFTCIYFNLPIILDKDIIFQVNFTTLGFVISGFTLIIAFTERSDNIRIIMKKGHMKKCVQSITIIAVMSFISLISYILNLYNIIALFSIFISVSQLGYILYVLSILAINSLNKG